MPYSPTTWTNGSTPVSQTNMNNIETGISGAYTELESITANDGTALPSSNGPFTLANFINYLTTLVKSIVGGSNWYSAPPTSLTSLNTGKANLSGATFTGAVQATALTASSAGVTVSGANQGVELGAKASANTPFVDMNSSGFSNDYDVRMIASGGTNATNGQGTLNIAAAALTHNGQTVWDNGNDGPGSGLEADKLRSAGSVGIKTNDNGTTVAVEVAPDTGARHLYLGGRDSGGATHFGVKVNSTSGLVDFIAGQPTMNGGANPMFYGAAGLTGKFSAQSTAPSSPADGDLWLDTSTVLS